MTGLEFVKGLVPSGWKRKLHKRVVSSNVRHHSGVKVVELARNEAAVTCLVKNGEFYIRSFIDHYSAMGFRHIFILDNGSTDHTVSIAEQHPNVSIYHSSLEVDKYQGLLKGHLAETAVTGGWCLDVDIDEFFDYPYSNVAPLGQLLEYLNQNHYTAVLTQMLDMFSEAPLSHLTKKQNEDLRETYRFYDLSAVEKTNYRRSPIANQFGQHNVVSNDELAIYHGGVRKTLYGNNCLLSKHSLFVRQPGLELFPHVHFVNQARLADISCALLHYKLTSNAFETASQNQKAFVGISNGYRQFIDVMTNQPDHLIKQNGASELRSIHELVENNFLIVSDEYRKFVNGLPCK